MSNSTILSPLDSADLLDHGLLVSGSTPGTLRLHKRRLQSSSDEEHSHIPLNTPPSSPAALETSYATIPSVLISYQTLLYVGFSEKKANELWTQWSNWPPHGPRRETDPNDDYYGVVVAFDEFFISSFKTQPDATDDNTEEWRLCLERCGMSVDVQDAIMDPHFECIRLSNSCLYWIKDTLEMRYAGLLDIQKTSRQRQMQLQRAASRPSGNQGSSSGRQGTGLDPATDSSPSSRQNTRSASETQQQQTPGISQHTWGSATATEACKPVPGHTLLFRGQDRGRISDLFDQAGNLDRLGALASGFPSDFSGFSSLFCFSPDYRVAEYHAAYAKTRAGVESVVIICLSIPDAAIERLVAPDILHVHWPSDEWKELVWRSRRALDILPRLQKYREATLIVGTVSRGPDSCYRRMSSWQEVSEVCLLKVGCQREIGPCLQYVFSTSDKGFRFLTENGVLTIRQYPNFV
jgi:hypothetical protein